MASDMLDKIKGHLFLDAESTLPRASLALPAEEFAGRSGDASGVFPFAIPGAAKNLNNNDNNNNEAPMTNWHNWAQKSRPCLLIPPKTFVQIIMEHAATVK